MNNAEKYHTVNGIPVEQRMSDGFINATAMCRSQRKQITAWFRNSTTFELIQALANDLGLNTQSENSHFGTIANFARAYPKLVMTRRGGANESSHTWLHPDLAIQLAQWCSPVFAIQVSRWVREWMLASQGSQGYDDNADFKNAVIEEIKNLKGEVRQLVNLRLIASKEHPGLGELIDRYGEDDLEVPLGLPNPFTYTEWALCTGFTDTGGNLRRRVAESVKTLRKVKKLGTASNGHKLYWHSDLPAFKTALEDVQGNQGKVADFRRYRSS